MIRSPGQILAAGMVIKLVDSGYDDSPSSPIATGSWPVDSCFCLMQPSCFPSGTVGGYYTWDGSQIVFAAWPGASAPWSAEGGVHWQIFEVQNLADIIKRVAGNVTLTTASGYANYDYDLAAAGKSVGDYNKAMVLPQSFGYALVTGYTKGHHERLIDNNTLRRRHYQVSGAIGNVYHSTVIVPLD